MRTRHHGTTEQISSIDREMCLTDDVEIAESYGPTVYDIEVSDELTIADEDDIWAAAETVYGDVEDHYGYRPYVYELADEQAVRDQLAAEGFGGCEYRDLNPDNNREHDTLRVWDVAALTLARLRGQAMTNHEHTVTVALTTWRADEAREEQSRATLHDALRAAMRAGVTAYRLADLTGLSERHIGRIREEDDMTRTYWTCVGSVRGECGVHHRTEDAAERHCAKDDRDVKYANGHSAYSDRRPVEREG